MHAQTSSAADTSSLAEQEEEENFDLALIASLEMDVVPCLGDDRVPDYLITRLAKVLQQGSQLLQHELDEDYPPTPTSLVQSDDISAAWGGKADNEGVGSTAPLHAVSRERFSYWCLDLLFLICSDTSKGKVCATRLSLLRIRMPFSLDREVSRRRVAALSLPALIGRCRTTLVGYVADEKLRGNLPFPRWATGYPSFRHCLIGCAECEKKSCCTCCTSCGSFAYGRDRSGQLSQKPRQNMRMSSLVLSNSLIFVPFLY